jgi:phosphoglycerate dehydrogenase-like enzyme
MEFRSVALEDFSRESQVRAMRGYDAVIIGVEPFTGEMIEDLSDSLKAVIRFGVGYDTVDIDTAARLGIPVANTPGANSTSVAEHALTLILALRKKLTQNFDRLRAGTWIEPVGGDLTGKTVGFVGFGAVGKKLARLLKGFSCRLLAYDPFFSKEDAEALGVEYFEMEDIAKLSDVVSLHLPLNDKTKKIIGHGFLEKMKKDSLLINTSRGGVVDEDALVESLLQGQIGGAGLDVFDVEPLCSGHPLLKAENVVLTPHVAAATYETALRTYEMALDTIEGILAGKKCENILNM